MFRLDFPDLTTTPDRRPGLVVFPQRLHGAHGTKLGKKPNHRIEHQHRTDGDAFDPVVKDKGKCRRNREQEAPAGSGTGQ